MVEGLDPRKLSFSQAQDYEELPQPLKLEELPRKARTHIWNALYASISSSVEFDEIRWARTVGGVWEKVLFEIYSWHDHRPIDKWDNSFDVHSRNLRESIETQPFNRGGLRSHSVHPPPSPVSTGTDQRAEGGVCVLRVGLYD